MAVCAKGPNGCGGCGVIWARGWDAKLVDCPRCKGKGEVGKGGAYLPPRAEAAP